MSSSDFFRLIGETSGLNVIVDPSVPEIGPFSLPYDQHTVGSVARCSIETAPPH